MDGVPAHKSETPRLGVRNTPVWLAAELFAIAALGLFRVEGIAALPDI